MTSTEKWNKICDYFIQFKTEPEEKIQMVWEKLFSELFGYSSLDGEIDAHRKIQLGSTERLIPDIIIKNKNTDLFMVELKREDLKIDDSRKKQLYSYLKQERNDLGILICDQICIINYDYNKSDDDQEFCVIDFVKDNPQGIKFVEIFEKENFDKNKVIAFIKECNAASTNIEAIKKELTPELVKKLVFAYLQNEYNESEINQALAQYNFNVSLKTSVSPAAPKVYFNPSFTREYTPNVTSDKTEFEKLMRDIRSVGMETFIKYFEYYNDPNCETADIKNLFRQYENFSTNSMASKASTGKGIIRRGNAKAALTIIAEAGNVSSELRNKAREYLEQMN